MNNILNKANGAFHEPTRNYENVPNIACCSNCKSTVISRVKRSLLQKLMRNEAKLYCHDCHNIFWKKPT